MQIIACCTCCFLSQVRRSGALSDVHTLWELVGTGAMSGSVEEILEHHKPSFDRLPSINAFDKVHNVHHGVVVHLFMLKL